MISHITNLHSLQPLCRCRKFNLATRNISWGPSLWEGSVSGALASCKAIILKPISKLVSAWFDPERGHWVLILPTGGSWIDLERHGLVKTESRCSEVEMPNHECIMGYCHWSGIDPTPQWYSYLRVKEDACHIMAESRLLFLLMYLILFVPFQVYDGVSLFNAKRLCHYSDFRRRHQKGSLLHGE